MNEITPHSKVEVSKESLHVVCFIVKTLCAPKKYKNLECQRNVKILDERSLENYFNSGNCSKHTAGVSRSVGGTYIKGRKVIEAKLDLYDRLKI